MLASTAFGLSTLQRRQAKGLLEPSRENSSGTFNNLKKIYLAGKSYIFNSQDNPNYLTRCSQDCSTNTFVTD